PHTPNNPAQLWRVTKWSHGDLYAIENPVVGNYMLPSTPEVHIVERDLKLPVRWSHQVLWAIDKSMCALEQGNMVVAELGTPRLIGSGSFRSVMISGHVLAKGVPSIDGDLYLMQEALEGDEGRKQKWLLQKQQE
ncbi:MAG: hypothetical protein Q9180_007991, partial [Flavoplaca navasiana]